MIIKKTFTTHTNKADSEVENLIETYFKWTHFSYDSNDKRIIFKRKYKYKSNYWERILKKLSYDDTIIVEKELDKELRFKISIDLSKQLFFTVISIIILVFIFWKMIAFQFISSIIVVIIPMIIFWISLLSRGFDKLKLIKESIIKLLK